MHLTACGKQSVMGGSGTLLRLSLVNFGCSLSIGKLNERDNLPTIGSIDFGRQLVTNGLLKAGQSFSQRNGNFANIFNYLYVIYINWLNLSHKDDDNSEVSTLLISLSTLSGPAVLATGRDRYKTSLDWSNMVIRV